jgi:hypothetical protein
VIASGVYEADVAPEAVGGDIPYSLVRVGELFLRGAVEEI